ncbi:MAG: hypothetical protein JXB88_17720 [Spirochaetales bacterium]|nr:hypothetical protein [Spirochaetales bacterium]
MEPTKITAAKLQGVIDELLKGSEDARGTFLYKDFRLQISKYKASGAERTSRLYHKRRELGLCIRCGTKVKNKNPRTGKLYRLCDHHRNLIDRKEGSTQNETVKKTTGTGKKTAGKSKAKSSTVKKTVSKRKGRTAKK